MFVASGQVGLDVATVNNDGLRGIVAARDFEEGEILAAVPYNCSFELLPGKWGLTGPVGSDKCSLLCTRNPLKHLRSQARPGEGPCRFE